jgi:hypothetical protein
MQVTPHLLYTEIELDNDETNKLVYSTDVASTVMGLGALIQPVVATILVTLVKLQSTRIGKANKGNGVIIAIPHATGLISLAFIRIKARE